MPAIARDHRDSGRELVLLTVLKGAVVFLADLSRELPLPHRLEFMAISAYRGAQQGSSGRLRLLKDIDRPVRDCDVLIVEDVVDTGLTLNSLLKMLRFRGAASVEVCTLLDRPYRRLAEITPRYTGLHGAGRLRRRLRLRPPAALPQPPDIHLLVR